MYDFATRFRAHSGGSGVQLRRFCGRCRAWRELLPDASLLGHQCVWTVHRAQTCTLHGAMRPPLVRYRPSGRWAVGPLGRWAVGPLGRWAVGPLGRWAVGPWISARRNRSASDRGLRTLQAGSSRTSAPPPANVRESGSTARFHRDSGGPRVQSHRLYPHFQAWRELLAALRGGARRCLGQCPARVRIESMRISTGVRISHGNRSSFMPICMPMRGGTTSSPMMMAMP